VCIAARDFSALCALQAVLIGFFSVKIGVGSTGISRHFLVDILCRVPRLSRLSTGFPSQKFLPGVPLTVTGPGTYSSFGPHTGSLMSAHLSRLLGYASFSDICGACFGFGSGFGIGFTLLLTRSFTRSSSSRHPPFTQYPFPSRSLVRGEQTSPHMPRQYHKEPKETTARGA
jgi:hypothetical protein